MSEQLNKIDLHSIFVSSLNGIRSRDLFHFKVDYKNSMNHGQWDNYNEVRKFFEPTLNKLFFDPVIKNHPDLSHLVDEFWNEFKTEKYIESVLSRIFSDKLTVNDIKDLLFIDTIKYSDTNRKDFLTRFISKEPTLINDLQAELISKSIKIHGENGAIRKGDLMAYFELLPKYHKEITDKTMVKPCIDLIKGSKLSPTNNIKALTTLFKILPKNSETIEYIEEIFSKYLKEQHNLRAKFNTYKEKIVGLNNTSNISINADEVFTCKVSLPEHILIDNFKIPANNISYIVDSFGNLLKNVLTIKEPSAKVYWQLNHPNPSFNTIYLYNNNYESHKETKELTDKVLGDFSEIIDKFRLILAGVKVPSKEQIETIKKVVDTYSIKYNLDETLTNEEAKISKKIKI